MHYLPTFSGLGCSACLHRLAVGARGRASFPPAFPKHTPSHKSLTSKLVLPSTILLLSKHYRAATDPKSGDLSGSGMADLAGSLQLIRVSLIMKRSPAVRMTTKIFALKIFPEQQDARGGSIPISGLSGFLPRPGWSNPRAFRRRL